MPEGERGRSAAERPGPERSGNATHFAAAGGPGSAALDRADAVAPPSAAWADEPLLRGVVDATALLAGLLLAGCGTVLAVRRLAGAMARSPGPTVTLAAAAGAAALFLVADRGSRRGGGRLSGRLARFGLVTAVAALALPLPSTASATITAVVALVAACAGLGIATATLRGRRDSRRPEPPRPASAPRQVEGAAEPVTTPEPPPAWDATMQQRFERLTLADGSECVRGRVRVAVTAGSRLGVAHVGFCPPFAALPAVEATTEYDGVEAVVSAAEVLPWGVRIECRLDEPAEETIDIPVDLLATAAA